MNTDEQLRDLGPYPKCHIRTQILHKAKSQLDFFLDKWLKVNELTSAEYTTLLVEALRSFGYRLIAIERRET